MRVRSEDGKTIAAHRALIEGMGSACLGKMGQPIGPSLLTRLNEQLDHRISTYLFLTTREGWNGQYVTYRCALKAVSRVLAAEQVARVPVYYGDKAALVSTWFEITTIDRLTNEQMNAITVISSGRSIMSVIKSSAALFKVRIP